MPAWPTASVQTLTVRDGYWMEFRLWVQSLGATQARNLSAGVLIPKVFLGRWFRRSATLSNCDCVKPDRSALLGKYWRSNPLVFSLVPRCQGLLGSQKYTFTSVATEKLACWDISLP